MKKGEFKEKLATRISSLEAEMLRTSDPGLYISDFNREVCLRIIDAPVSDDDSEINERDVRKLEDSIVRVKKENVEKRCVEEQEIL
jgi:hypothetical protein